MVHVARDDMKGRDLPRTANYAATSQKSNSKCRFVSRLKHNSTQGRISQAAIPATHQLASGTLSYHFQHFY
jgi:hypothetical protein